MRMRDPGNGCNVAHRHQGIGGRLDMHEFRFRTNRFFHCLGIGGIHVSEFKSVVDQHLIEQARHAAIDVRAADDVVPSLHHREHGSNRGHAASKYMRGGSAFKRSQVLLKPCTGGIGDAGVLVSFILANLFLHVGGGGENGNGNGAGGGIGFLACVDSSRSKTAIRILMLAHLFEDISLSVTVVRSSGNRQLFSAHAQCCPCRKRPRTGWSKLRRRRRVESSNLFSATLPEWERRTTCSARPFDAIAAEKTW